MIEKALINDMEVEYEVIHRKVKNARLEIKSDKIRLIMPMNHFNTDEIIKNHEKWIYKKVVLIKHFQSEAEKRKLKFDLSEEDFKTMVKELILEFTRDLGVDFNKVFFKKMRSRWGSCSSRKNLNINKYLRFLPNPLIEYVVYHEVAHLVEMSHNKTFWNIISFKYPDYKDIEDELLVYWLCIKKCMEKLD
jgi:predicted metal-dependent hydrolase